MRKTATIQDVARLAGVSTATVSRVLSSPGKVAEATRAAVLEAVRATDFRRNRQAANLRRRRTGSVIALVPNLANPFFAQILAGVASVLTPAGYGLLIADTRTDPDPDARLAHFLEAGAADGLILFDGTLSPAALARPGHGPVIAACEWLDMALPSVTVDNAHGADLAVRHLAGLGHRRIGHVMGPEGNVLTDARRAGFLSAIRDLGLPERPDWMLPGDFSIASGAQAAEAWLALGDRPTALFCASDQMALGFMGTVQHAGLSAPGDVSLVGFDDLEVSAHLTPALTTIRQLRRQIGERAAALLLGMIESRTQTCESEIIPVELIVRASTAAPRQP